MFQHNIIKAIKIQPDRAESFYILGCYLFNVEKFELAYFCFKKCATKNIIEINKKYSLYVNHDAYSEIMYCYLARCFLYTERMNEFEELFLKYKHVDNNLIVLYKKNKLKINDTRNIKKTVHFDNSLIHNITKLENIVNKEYAISIINRYLQFQLHTSKIDFEQFNDLFVTFVSKTVNEIVLFIKSKFNLHEHSLNFQSAVITKVEDILVLPNTKNNIYWCVIPLKLQNEGENIIINDDSKFNLYDLIVINEIKYKVNVKNISYSILIEVISKKI